MIDPNEKIRLVELTAYDAEWPNLFRQEAHLIKAILKDNCLQIHHIGSTAIPYIYAKPIIDILPVVKNIQLIDSLNSKFEELGYICMSEYGIPGRRFYWKSKAKRTHHIHLFQEGSAEITRHLAFRDFMIQHKTFAQAYSLIKRNLAEVFPTDIENYVNGKASFVQYVDYQAGSARDAQLNAFDDIIIEPYNTAWPKLADAELKTIKAIAAPLNYISMEHIGSTAVPELASKPIIDILIVVKSMGHAIHWIKPLETLGYIFWSENPDKTHFRFFKGMPPFGMKRTHHIHIVDENNKTAEQRILFRDILRKDPKTRSEYQALKLNLAESFKIDRESYTQKKGEFIEKVLRAYSY